MSIPLLGLNFLITASAVSKLKCDGWKLYQRQSIIRYLRFYTEYSKIDHEINIIKIIKKNIEGLGKISKERQFNELKKILKLDNFLKLFNNKTSCELFSLIFPQLKNFKKLSK